MGVLTGFLLPKREDLHRGMEVSTGVVIWGVEKCPFARTRAQKAPWIGPEATRWLRVQVPRP